MRYDNAICIHQGMYSTTHIWQIISQTAKYIGPDTGQVKAPPLPILTPKINMSFVHIQTIEVNAYLKFEMSKILYCEQ